MGWTRVESQVAQPLVFRGAVSGVSYHFPERALGLVDSRDVPALVESGKFQVV